MQLTLVKNYQEMSECAANQLIAELRRLLDEKERVSFLPSAGKTPTLLYSILAEKYRHAIDWQRVDIFQMDEYLGLEATHPASFSAYLYQHLIQPLSIQHFHFINQFDLAKMAAYENLIANRGFLDVALHGIGTNGHIGFNEPGSSIETGMRFVELDESTRIANRNLYFESLDDVPKTALTLGLQTLQHTKRNILLASGDTKVAAISRLLKQSCFIAELPASALLMAPYLHLITDTISE